MEYHKGPAALGLQGKPKTNAKMLEEAGIKPVVIKQERKAAKESRKQQRASTAETQVKEVCLNLNWLFLFRHLWAPFVMPKIYWVLLIRSSNQNQNDLILSDLLKGDHKFFR